MNRSFNFQNILRQAAFCSLDDSAFLPMEMMMRVKKNIFQNKSWLLKDFQAHQINASKKLLTPETAEN